MGEILTGYHKPWRDDPNFIIAMARCNDAQNFIPLQKKKEISKCKEK